MCGRYSPLSEDEIVEIREIIREVSLRLAHDDFEDYVRPDSEVFPTNHAPVLTKKTPGEVSFENLRWGFKKWDGKGVIINARAESLGTKNTFKGLLAAGRCVVPAREYYEWKQVGKDKAKHFIKDKDGNLLFMAGLYRDGEDGREFVIITKGAYGEVVPIHDRMPVILRADQIEAWLSGELSPEEIANLDFNVDVNPCEGECVQMTLPCCDNFF
ncbi:MAG: SOS response-associated peptidase [Defluviitaleaceae bacterium]|nr:SOS response-associated peptidase [Defluviitaleaceae bacterium]